MVDSPQKVYFIDYDATAIGKNMSKHKICGAYVLLHL
jgi:hypothetical protein